ncbi:bacillithiol system redox-active protein YtxJ [Pinibacter soli]|uniref:Bacillithiol system redox-active protein YtxJ n=1 Tax=Pinibacter soli TaxID=3044211 RepID=A0ABT6R8Y7_9BACT|nr:bacillithiol system redox-active protein YtxJ [Pinibacter soli]MDI3319025.1 bacillithiol system redox-active protein YtxJ [Pinibacter soli]
MKWNILNSEQQLDEIKKNSGTKPQVIFKHSTRCSVSSMAKSRLDREKENEKADFHYLDLIAHRNISNKIAEDFSIRHESPQILLIKNGECVYDESHMGINIDEIEEKF